MACKNNLINKMISNQQEIIEDKYRLEKSDICRMCKYIDDDIFDSDECILWSGYLTSSNKGKSQYVNFYLKGKKLALHRILYINFIDELQDYQYVKYICRNAGKCCNINHFYKVDKENDKEEKIESKIKIPKLNDRDSIRSSLSIMFDD